MAPKKDSVVFTGCSELSLDERREYIYAFYLMLLNPTGSHLQEGWATSADQNGILNGAAQAFQDHLGRWNEQNTDNLHLPLIEMDKSGESENGWLRLSEESEAVEFEALQRVWDLAIRSVKDNQSDEEFFQLALEAVQDSGLFTSLKKLVVQRPDNRIKKVWEHIKNVTIKSTTGLELTDSGKLTANRRKAELRLIAFTHDVLNIVFADADFLQFHAHAGAEFLYRFFRIKLNFDHKEAARIIRVVDLHHILELIKIDSAGGQQNRVLDAQEVVRAFAEMENGWEIFGRLMRFALVDVSEKLEFQAEHVASLLAIVNALVSQAEVAISNEVRQLIATEAFHAASQFVNEINQEYEANSDANLLAEQSEPARQEQMKHPLSERLQMTLNHIQRYLNTLIESIPSLSGATLELLASS